MVVAQITTVVVIIVIIIIIVALTLTLTYSTWNSSSIINDNIGRKDKILSESLEHCVDSMK